jgi:hypothetical protein
LLGSQIGVRTNANGEYRLKIPNGGATVLVRAIGFKRASTVIGATQTTADFALDKDVLQLEGVTVTGQATTVDRRNASTAIASVTAEELMQAPAKSVEGNLAGKVVGATVFENSGVPGGGMQIQIRGATSILGQTASSSPMRRSRAVSPPSRARAAARRRRRIRWSTAWPT